MFTIVRSTQSTKDYAEIWRYIAESSEVEADKFIVRLDERVEMLALNNLVGRPRPELGDAYRSLLFGKYVVFYRPTLNGIELLRVLHSARDLKRLRFPK